MRRTNYTFANTAEEIRRLAAADPRAARALETSLATARDWIVSFSDDPARLSGYVHDFCCPSCTTRLAFDPHLAFSPPNVFTCPHCGMTASGPELDEAWVYCYRYRAAVDLEAVAVAALLGEEEAYAYFARFLDFYAAHYADFPVHGSHAGKGKIMGQSLDEAVWACAVLRAAASCGLFARVDEEKRRFWRDALFLPLAELILPQGMHIHNIPTWLHCAAAEIALAFGDDALLARALDGEYGIRNQVARGFTADAIWHECSLGYHFYTIEALTYFLAAFAVDHPDDPLLETLGRLVSAKNSENAAPLAFSRDGWRLQAVNDGWYPLTLDAFATLVLRAARIVSDPALDALAARVLARASEERLASPASLLVRLAAPPAASEPPAPPDSVALYADTRFAFVREPVWAILKSGVLCRSHMQRDYNSLILPPYSDDLGTPGYGHPLYHDWYRQGASHNVVTIDGAVPDVVLPSRVERTPTGVRAVVESWPLPGFTRAERTLDTEGAELVDRCDYACAGGHVFDWIFHAAGDAAFSSAGEKAPPLGEDFGYRHFRDVRRMDVAPGAVFTARFTCEGRTLRLATRVDQELEVYTARAPGNPADQLRTVILLRRRGDTARFEVRFAES